MFPPEKVLVLEKKVRGNYCVVFFFFFCGGGGGGGVFAANKKTCFFFSNLHTRNPK